MESNRSPKERWISAAATEGFSVGIRVGHMFSRGSAIINLVHPTVVVHVVNKETGAHIKSARRAMSGPIRTRQCSLRDAASVPTWDEDIILDAGFSDVVDSNTVLLFELVDSHPVLSTRGEIKKRPEKGIAWGFLLPVGVSGSFNVAMRKSFFGGGPDVAVASASSANNVNNNNTTTARRTAVGAAGDIDAIISPRGRLRDRLRKGQEQEDERAEGEAVSSPLSSPQRDEGQGQGVLENELADAEVQEISGREGDDVTGPEEDPALDSREVDNYVPEKDLVRRIQLFEYTSGGIGFTILEKIRKGFWRDSTSTSRNTTDDSSPSNVPEVFWQWKRKTRKPLDKTGLLISLGPRRYSGIASGGSAFAVQRELSTSAMEIAMAAASMDSVSAGGDARVTEAASSTAISEEALAKMRAAVMERSRAPREPCVVPDQLLHRLDVGPEGAMVVAFSHAGHLLAVAAKSPSLWPSQQQQTHASRDVPGTGAHPAPGANSVISNSSARQVYTQAYTLRLYDPDLGVEVWSQPHAHRGVIYDVKWSLDDSCLLTCAGDGSCQVWDVLGLHPAVLKHQRILRKQLSAEQASAHASVSAAAMSAAVGIESAPPASARLPPGKQSPLRDLSSSGRLAKLLSKISPLPKLIQTFATSPPVFLYCAVFQEYESDLGTEAKIRAAATSAIGTTLAGSATSSPGSYFMQDFVEKLESAADGVAAAGVSSSEAAGGGGGMVTFNRAMGVPAVITGSSDGRLRVWEVEKKDLNPPQALLDASGLKGDISIGEGHTAHEGRINSLVIDQRSRYLLSGDNLGEVIVWRCDNRGWYQLLRKFRREEFGSRPGLHLGAAAALMSRAGDPDALLKTGVTSLVMHPDKLKAQILVMSQSDPTSLKVYNMTTYKCQSTCVGFTSIPPAPGKLANVHTSLNDVSGSKISAQDGVDAGSSSLGSFCRAAFSADGNYVVAGVCKAAKEHAGSASYSLKVWDSQTGHVVNTQLSALSFPSAARCVSWHPRQHVIAVASVGHGAAVVLYSRNRESAEAAVRHSARVALASFINATNTSQDEDSSAGLALQRPAPPLPSAAGQHKGTTTASLKKNIPALGASSAAGSPLSPRRSGNAVSSSATPRFASVKARIAQQDQVFQDRF